MTDEIKEPLSVEEPKKEEKPAIDVDGLVAELEKSGITNSAELEGKLRASQETGRLAQLLGDERKKTAEYEAMLRELQSRPQPKQQQDYMDYNEGQPIDIEAAIERSVGRVFDKREQAQRAIQEQNLKKWNFIQGDKDYSVVKEIWENKLKDPNFVYQIQAGVVDPIQDYNDTKIEYYKELLKKSHETLKTMSGAGKPPPPHMETGGRTSANLVSETPSESEGARKIKALKEKTNKGYLPSEEETLDLIGSIFDDDLPIKPPKG